MHKPQILFFDIDGTLIDMEKKQVTPDFDAMAFGDGNNDLEMFGAAGTCVAMANGSADLKAAATHLCGSCAEDGIYHFCAENGLI